jgi:uncharacterized protein (UPF0128 family)
MSKWKIYHLGQEIQKSVPTTKLIISEVIIRNDDPQISAKVKEVNSKLLQVCKNNKWNINIYKKNKLNIYCIFMIYDKTTQIFIVFIINHKNTINTIYLVMFLWWRTNVS